MKFVGTSARCANNQFYANYAVKKLEEGAIVMINTYISEKIDKDLLVPDPETLEVTLVLSRDRSVVR